MADWLKKISSGQLFCGSTEYEIVLSIRGVRYRYEGSYWVYDQFHRRWAKAPGRALVWLKKYATGTEVEDVARPQPSSFPAPRSRETV